jgi:hypothetical protein
MKLLLFVVIHSKEAIKLSSGKTICSTNAINSINSINSINQSNKLLEIPGGKATGDALAIPLDSYYNVITKFFWRKHEHRES